MDRGARVALVVGLVLLTWGCGYRLAGAGVGDVDSIAIRTPRNESFEPGVEYLVADALRRELLRRESGALVDDPARADVVVSGRILPVDSRPRSLSSAIIGREQEVVLALDLEAMRRDGTRVPLPERRLRESERYLMSADIEAERKNREEALRRLAALLATRFFDEMGEALSR